MAPNAVINVCNHLLPGSVLDKTIVLQSGILDVLAPGDMVLADEGFLISDILPKGVTVNILPFLNKGKFTESEIRATREIARNQGSCGGRLNS